jgi:SAM-dependent methyltransferase
METAVNFSDETSFDSTPSFIDRYEQCPLCGSTQLTADFTFDINGAHLTWDRCSECRLVFQNPRLTEESIRSLYASTSYFGSNASNRLSGYVDYVKNDPMRIIQSRSRVAQIQKISGIKGGRLLDIGSASGFFGVAAREAGFEVTCLEPDAQLSEYGRTQYGLDFWCDTFDSCNIEPNSFDAITLWGTDSHFMHPLHSFEKIAEVLKTDGVLAMNYQNFDHVIRQVFPRIKVGWNVMYNFSDRSFDVLLRKLGLTLIYRGLEWQTVSVDHLFRVVRWKQPPAFRKGFLTLPAVSFPLVIAVKRP